MCLTGALVSCIDAESPFETQRSVAALFGRVFALYCAFSVQLGAPKHKIDVDPQSWAALMTIPSVAATGLGAMLFPRAAREVVAILTALEHEHNAFLKCLRGFGHQFRVRAGRASTGAAAADGETEATDGRRRAGVGSGVGASDLATLVRDEQVAQLDALTSSYSQAMVHVRMSASASASAPTAGIGRTRLGHQNHAAAVVELSESHASGRADLLARLRTYLASKSADATSQELQDVHGRQSIAGASDSDTAAAAAAGDTGASDNEFAFEFDDPDALFALEPAPQPTTTSRAKSPAVTARRPRQSQSSAVPARRQAKRARTAVPSIASSDSDALALLEAELSRDVLSSSGATTNILDIEQPPSRPQSRKRQRTSAMASALPVTAPLRRVGSVASVGSAMTFASDAGSDGLAELEAELKASIAGPQVGLHGAAPNETHSSGSEAESVVNSASDASETESDDGGLAELEAELEANVRAGAKKPRAPAKRAAASDARVAPAATKTAKAAKSRVAAAAPRRRKLSDALSIASESDDGALAALQAELELDVLDAPVAGAPSLAQQDSAAPSARATTAKPPAKRSGGIVRRQRSASVSSAVSIATTVSDDGALAELQAELALGTGASATALAAPIDPPVARKPTSRASKPSARQQPQPKSAAIAAVGIAPRAGIIMRRTRAASIAASESDGGALDELQAELAQTVGSSLLAPAVAIAVESPRASRKRKRVATATASSVATESDNGDLMDLQAELDCSVAPAPANPTPRAPLPRQTHATAPRKPATRGRRKVSDAVSIATTESDGGLAELEAELAQSVASASKPTALETREASAVAAAEASSGDNEALAANTRRPATRRAKAANAKDKDAETREATVRNSSSGSTRRTTRSSASPADADVATTSAAVLGKPPTGKARAAKQKAAPPKPKPAAKRVKAAPKARAAAPATKRRASKASAEALEVTAARLSTPAPPVAARRTLTPARPTRSSGRSNASVATSDGESDGLDELEAELQASLA